MSDVRSPPGPARVFLRRARLSLSALCLTVCAAPSARAEDAQGGLSSLNAVEIAVQNNPSLHVALLQETQARYNVSAEEALYDAVFDANGTVSHNKSPTLRGTDGTLVTTTDTFGLGASLTKTFALGTTVQAAVSGQRRLSVSPPIGTLGGTNAVGPAYSLVGTLSLTQPFLRGAGTDLGLASLRVARLNQTSASLAARQAGSQVLHDVLTAYWELWYSSEALVIDRASRDLAKTLQTQAEQQVLSGTLAKVDALPYYTQVATQEETLLAQATDLRQRSLALADSIGRADRVGPDLNSTDAPPDVTLSDSGETMVAEALTASYELKQLSAQLQISQDQARLAGDALRPQLNLNASVSAQGLGNQQVSPAFDQFGRLEAVSAQVGLTFETPVTDTRRKSQVESALLSVRIAEKQIESARQQLRTDVQTALSRTVAAKERLNLAQVTEKVAGEQAEGQRGKFLAGTALSIEVQQADDAHRQAQLRVQRARVDLAEGELDLLHLRGALLKRYASVLTNYKPTALILSDTRDPM